MFGRLLDRILAPAIDSRIAQREQQIADDWKRVRATIAAAQKAVEEFSYEAFRDR